MKAPAILRSRLGLIGLLLVIVGGLLAFGTVTWSVERRYGVAIDAPDGLSWTVWLPRPELAASPSVEGGVSSISTVVTPHGRLLNVTGDGPSRLWMRDGYLSLNPGNLDMPLDGAEWIAGNWTFWVWRGSGNGTAAMRLDGGTGWSESRIGDAVSCGGFRFFADLQEGWNAVPRGFSDCTHLILTEAWILPTIFLVPGGGLLAVAAWMVRRSTVD